MRSLSGPITFKRNHHQCEECNYGFTRMKRARQRWTMRNARRMARLRAAYRTAGASIPLAACEGRR